MIAGTSAQEAELSNQQLFEKGLDVFIEADEYNNDPDALIYMDLYEISLIYLEALNWFAQVRSEGDLEKSAAYYELLAGSRLLTMLSDEAEDSVIFANGVDLYERSETISRLGYPFHFEYKGKPYTVNYENFEYIKADILNTLFEVAGRMGDFPNSLVYARQAFALQSNTMEARLKAALFIIVAKESLQQLDVEFADAAISFSELYLSLSSQTKQDISDWLTAENAAASSWDAFSKALVANPQLKKDTERLWRMAQALNQLNAPSMIDAYRIALENSSSLTREQLLTILQVGKQSSEELALNAAGALAMQNLACTDYAILKEVYAQFNKPDLTLQMELKEKACFKESERQARRANYIRPRLWLGAHAFQYLDDKEDRDPGFELGIMHKNKVYSVFYTEINNKAYQTIDLYLKDITIPEFHPYYDGYKVGLNFRKSEDNFQNRKWTYYYNIQLAYAEERLRAFDDNVINLQTNETFTAGFAPIDHSYRLYAGLGSTYYFYVLGIDWSFNIGFSLNTFDLQDQSGIYNENYSFSNPLLEERKYNEYHYGTLMNISIITYLLL